MLSSQRAQAGSWSPFEGLGAGDALPSEAVGDHCIQARIMQLFTPTVVHRSQCTVHKPAKKPAKRPSDQPRNRETSYQATAGRPRLARPERQAALMLFLGVSGAGEQRAGARIRLVWGIDTRLVRIGLEVSWAGSVGGVAPIGPRRCPCRSRPWQQPRCQKKQTYTHTPDSRETQPSPNPKQALALVGHWSWRIPALLVAATGLPVHP